MTVDVCLWDPEEASLPQRAQPYHIEILIVVFIVVVLVVMYSMHACSSVFTCA